MSKSLTLAIFASDKGHGDAERTSIMSQVGSFLAKKNVRLIYPTRAGEFSVPLVKSARAAGVEVVVVSDTELALPRTVSGVTVETCVDIAACRAFVIREADALVALPGSLSSASELYETWMASGGTKPVALLNRNRAFELMRGFGVDIFAHTVPNWEQKLIIAETIDDLWSRLSRTLAAR